MATKRDFVFGPNDEMLPSDSTVAADRRREQAPKQTFGQAFAAARRAGQKTFTFNGKSYNTQTRDDVRKRDDAAFAKEEARSKTTRAVAGDSDNRQRDAEDRRRLAPIAAQGQRDSMAGGSRRAAAQRRSTAASKARQDSDTKTAGDKRFAKDTVRAAERRQERGRLQKDIDTAAAKRRVSGFAEGGSVRGYGMARGAKKCKIV